MKNSHLLILVLCFLSVGLTSIQAQRLVRITPNGISNGDNETPNSSEIEFQEGSFAAEIDLNTNGALQLGTGPNALSGITINVDNEVGIGTTTPEDKLHVNNSFGDVSAKILSQDGSVSSLKLFEGNDFGFEFLYDGNPDKLYLWSRNFAGNEDIRMTWLKNGKVGIGTTTPNAPLSVIAKSNFPSTNGIYIFNPVNAINENAILTTRVAGTSAGDPFISWDVSGEAGWSMGIDNSDGNKLKIAPSWSSLTSSPRMIIQPNGNIGFSLSNPTYLLHLLTNSAAKPSSSVWTISSDRRLKKNIEPFKDGLAVLQQINPVWYEYNGKANLPTGKKSIGIIAQDMQKIAPYMVGSYEYKDSVQAETYLDFDANALFYITINAVKEQQAELAEKEERLKSQETTISELRNTNIELQMQAEALEARLAKIEALLQGQSTINNPTINNSITTLSSARLEQNQPNPFDGSTMVRYFIPKGIAKAELRITNLQGTVIKSVAIQARGEGQVTFDATTLGSGTYQYSLFVDGQLLDTKHMILTRN